MARSKAYEHIKSVTNKLTKKKKHAQANRIRRRALKKTKRVC